MPRPSPGSDTAAMANIQQVYRYILSLYVDEVDPDLIATGAISGMLESLKDPYSVYMAQSDWREMTDITAGDFGGIGAYIEKERNKDGTLKTDGFIVIAAPIEGTPAWRADLRSNDLILKINSEATDAFSVDDGVKRLRGKPGATIELLIGRGKTAPFTVKLVREVIEVPTIRSAMIGDIGYVKVIQFARHTSEGLEKAIQEFKTKGMRGLIIDVRSNPGGVLEAPVQMADLFFDDGVLVSVKGRLSYQNQVSTATPGKAVQDDVPLIILINGSSASASEILSGAFKDRGRALLVGEKTYGKGVVQNLFELPPGGRGFKLTTSKYYTPSGISIDKIGIAPDYEIKEPVIGEADEKAILAVREKGIVEDFIVANPKASLDTISATAAKLRKDGIAISDRLFYFMVKRELNRKDNVIEVYDINFDDQLKKAIELVNDWSKVKKPLVNVSSLPVPVPATK